MGDWIANNLVALLALGLSGWALWGQYYRRKLTFTINPMTAAHSSSFGDARQEQLVVVTVTNHSRPLTVEAPYGEIVGNTLPLITEWRHTSDLGIPNFLDVAGAMSFEAGPRPRRIQEGETVQWALHFLGTDGTTGFQDLTVVVKITGGKARRSKTFKHDVTPPSPG